LGHFLSPVIKAHTEAHHVSHTTEYLLMGISSILVLGMIVFAWTKFKHYQSSGEDTGFGKVLADKWYVDEMYNKAIVNPLHQLGGFLKNIIDNKVIDGIVNGVGKAVQYGSRQLRLLQSGQVGVYVLLMVVSMVLVFVLQIFLKK
ncbi:MAG: hypothetical protein RL115_1658, partial [Bacteroidota bacterium]